MKSFAATFGSILLAIVISWGLCFSIHVAYERDITKKCQIAFDAAQKGMEINTADLGLTKMDANDLLQRIREARDSETDPLWFTHS